MATEQRTNGGLIYQTCLGLHNSGRLISRQVLAKTTNLKMSIVDDHVTRLVEDGKLRRVANGVVEIVEQFPPNRPMSKTVLPDGTVKAELGDDVMTLTPAEAQVFGAMFIGEATQYAQIRGDRDVQDRVARLEREAIQAKRRIEDQAKEIARLHKQPQLSFD